MYKILCSRCQRTFTGRDEYEAETLFGDHGCLPGMEDMDTATLQAIATGMACEWPPLGAERSRS